MTNTARTEHKFAPLLPEDFELFLGARSIGAEHRTRGLNANTGHTPGDRRACQTCRVQALDGLLAFANRATERAWTRDEALADLTEHPATFDLMAKDARRLEATANGRLAKPYEAAFGANCTNALTAAREASELAVPVRCAQELLGFAITAAQDPTVVVEYGHLLPWSAIAERLAAGPYPLPADLPAWALWDQIDAACNRVPRTARLFADHVYQHSEAGARQTASHRAIEDGDLSDLIAEAQDPSAPGSEADRFKRGIVARVAARLAAEDRVDPGRALAVTTRVVMDSFGSDIEGPVDVAVLEGLAEEAVEVAQRDLAISDAADELGNLSDPSGAASYRRWLEAAARDARLAQDRRLRSLRRG